MSKVWALKSEVKKSRQTGKGKRNIRKTNSSFPMTDGAEFDGWLMVGETDLEGGGR